MRNSAWFWVSGITAIVEPPVFPMPPAWLEPIHDRMLAVLDFAMATAFLRGETLPFASYAGNLIAEPCESPLKRTSPAAQGELF